MAIINKDKQLTNYSGEPLIDDKGKAFTVKEAVVLALNSQSANEQLSAEDRLKCFEITNKFYGDESEFELEVDEAAFIKKRAGVFLTPISYGRLCEVLNGK